MSPHWYHWVRVLREMFPASRINSPEVTKSFIAVLIVKSGIAKVFTAQCAVVSGNRLPRVFMSVVSVPIASLKPNPNQKHFYSWEPRVDIKALEESIEAYGQYHPIWITEDHMIVAGHRRTLAMENIGETHIDAILFDRENDPTTLLDMFIDENVSRRQMTPLEIARCYVEWKKRYECVYEDSDGTMRDVMAARLNLGKSGRTLDRLVQLLDLPNDIIGLIERRILTQTDGRKLLEVPSEQREKIFERIRNGEDAKMVVRELTAGKPNAEPTVRDHAKALLCRFQTLRPAIDGNLQDLDQLQLDKGDVVEELDALIDIFTRLRQRKLELRQESVAAFSQQLQHQ